jgi:hypothetical protein
VAAAAAAGVDDDDGEAKDEVVVWNDRARCRVARASLRAKDGARSGRKGIVRGLTRSEVSRQWSVIETMLGLHYPTSR